MTLLHDSSEKLPVTGLSHFKAKTRVLPLSSLWLKPFISAIARCDLSLVSVNFTVLCVPALLEKFVADFAMYSILTDDGIAKLYVIWSLVKKREMVENFVT